MEHPILARAMGNFSEHGQKFWTNEQSLGPVRRDGWGGWGLPQDWEREAACANTHIEWWFGNDSRSDNKKSFRTKAQTERAKAVCASCPVLAQCEEWVMSVRLPFGVVAVMTEGERMKAFRERPAPQQEQPKKIRYGIRTCAVCEAGFFPIRKDQRTCSTGCSASWRWTSRRERASQAS